MTLDSNVVVVCVGGIESKMCLKNVSDVEEAVELTARLTGKGYGVVLVTPSFHSLGDFYELVEEEDGNSFLVEVTGTADLVASGLSLEELIEFNTEYVKSTLNARKSAVNVYPLLTRRELLARILSLSRLSARGLIPRAVDPSCASSCPYNAIRDDGSIDEEKCVGCMLCKSICERSLNPLLSIKAVLTIYRFITSKSLDGIVFMCRRQLSAFEEHAVEVSPARLLPVRVPCISWIPLKLVNVLRSLDIDVFVFLDNRFCRDCVYSKASERAMKSLADAGVPVDNSLASASAVAFKGYTRKPISLNDVKNLIS